MAHVLTCYDFDVLFFEIKIGIYLQLKSRVTGMDWVIPAFALLLVIILTRGILQLNNY